MLSTDWKPRIFQSLPRSAFYAFMPTIDKEKLCMSPVGASSADGDVISSEDAEWIYPEQQVARILVELFKKVPQVKSICAQFGPEEITIWTLLETYDRAARESVYLKELEVCQKLGVYDFDFRATSIDLVSPEELTRSGSREIYRRH
jgi:hypothetical protein